MKYTYKSLFKKYSNELFNDYYSDIIEMTISDVNELKKYKSLSYDSKIVYTKQFVDLLLFDDLTTNDETFINLFDSINGSKDIEQFVSELSYAISVMCVDKLELEL